MGFRFSLQISHLLVPSLPSPVSLQGEVQPSGLGLLFGWLDLVLIFGLHPTDVHVGFDFWTAPLHLHSGHFR